jgi:hypothetical protein
MNQELMSSRGAVFWRNSPGELKKPLIKKFRLDFIHKNYYILVISTKNVKLKFYDFSNSGQKICRHL